MGQYLARAADGGHQNTNKRDRSNNALTRSVLTAISILTTLILTILYKLEAPSHTIKNLYWWNGK